MLPSITGGLAGIGQGLGTAHGSIVIDTSSADSAATKMHSVGQNIAKSMDPAAKAIAEIDRQLNELGRASSAGTAARAIAEIDRQLAELESAGRRPARNLAQNIASDIGPAQQAVDRYIDSFRNSESVFTRFGNAARGAFTTARDAASSFAQQVGNSLSAARNHLENFQRELTAVGLVAGLATRFGLGSARDIRAYRIAYETLLGSQREGDRIMRQLTASANEYGLEMESVLGLGRALIPILGENVDQTGEWVTRAARLRAVLPTAQQGAELRAITEYIADQTISLQRLFNIPPELIQEARAQFADAGEQLDFILDRMGATEEAALRMADPVVSLKNELKLIAAIGFTPLLEDVRDTATELRQWLETLRETNPEILQIGANAIAAVAVGAPLVLFLNQVLGVLLKIKAIGPLFALSKAGLLVGGTAFAAREGVRAFGRATGNEDQANINFRQMVAAAFAAFTQLMTGVAIVMSRVSKEFYDGVYSMVGAMGRFVEIIGSLAVRIGNILPDRLGGARLREFGEALQERGQTMTDNAEQWRQNNSELFQRAVDSMVTDMGRVIDNFGRWVGALPRGPETRTGPERARTSTSEPSLGGGGMFRQMLGEFVAGIPGGIAEWSTFWDELARIQSEESAEILEAEAEAARQRAEIIAAYDLRLTRDAEDFARQRARAEEDYQRQIDGINADRIEREAEWQQELNERLERISADAARERQRMEEDHQDNLLSAASRLDARAVAEEQRRYNRQRTRFEEDLQQRIDDERAAHQERIAQARAADEKRLADLQEFHERRQAREDEDRAIRLQRMEEDHEAQLAQFDEQQERRMQQIREQAAAERVAAAESYRQRLAEQGRFFTSMATEQAIRQGNMLEAWNSFLRDMERDMGRLGTGEDRRGGEGSRADRPSRQQLEQQGVDLMQQNGWSPSIVYQQTRAWRTWSDAELARWLEQTFGIDVPGYLMGTSFVPRTGLAMLHRGEAVIPPQMAAAMRSGASGGSTTLNIHRGAVNINAPAGASPYDIGVEVELAIIRIADRARRGQL